MSYNVENLFDDVDDGTEYPRYDPGRREWGAEEFHAKLDAVSEVIRKACRGGPDIVALQEVEGRRALDLLCDRYLGLYGYHYRVLVPVPGQAVHCALISRHPVVRTGALDPGPWDGARQRIVLEAEIDLEGHTLYVLNNHWKSKSGGVPETEPARRASAEVVRRRTAELLGENPAAELVVLGDFNDNVNEYTEVQQRYITALMPAATLAVFARAERAPAHVDLPPAGCLFVTGRPEEAGLRDGAVTLFDAWFTLPPQARGSYVYRGRWQTPDHVLLAPGLFDEQGLVYRPDGFRVMRRGFLVHAETGHPRSTAARPYSDHLPLLVTLDTVR